MDTLADEEKIENQKTSEISRGKTPKLKVNKENYGKNSVAMEMKIEKLQKKLSVQDMIENEYQEKIHNMQEEIDVLKAEKGQL